MSLTFTAIGAPRIGAGFDRFPRLGLGQHRAMHGKIPEMGLGDLIELVERVDLRGRGGAAFPVGRKLAATSKSGPGAVVLVNGAEGEPGSAKDALLLTRAPHLVLDGAQLVATALKASEIVIGIEGAAGLESVQEAIAEREAPQPFRVVPLLERFISGEGGALVRAANGEDPIPPGRKLRAAVSGVDGLPTLLSNAETFAQLAVLASLGAELYASAGTDEEPGTVLLTVAAEHVVEVPTGTPLADVFAALGVSTGQGVLTGGYHGSWLSPDAAQVARVSRSGLEAVGGSLGAGILLPLAEGVCPLGESLRVASYLAAQSAGQCGPCRLGLPEVVRTLSDLMDGLGGVTPVRRAVGIGRGRGACKHPDGTAAFVLSAMTAFAEDIAIHAEFGSCNRPVRGLLHVPGDENGRLEVDWARCAGHGVCAYVLPEVIRLDRNGYPVVSNNPLPTWLERDVRKAVAMCPALALRRSPR
ncbi:ferredoxin [Actinocorallia longicatena]|uniref:NADH-quinone oxidoreductase subunit NuoF family protein n=1 Tax=Actinocorallia longicatena TaxID=111803 RepID=A0ABP6QMN5_9ACTN